MANLHTATKQLYRQHVLKCCRKKEKNYLDWSNSSEGGEGWLSPRPVRNESAVEKGLADCGKAWSSGKRGERRWRRSLFFRCSTRRPGRGSSVGGVASGVLREVSVGLGFYFYYRDFLLLFDLTYSGRVRVLPGGRNPTEIIESGTRAPDTSYTHFSFFWKP